MSTATYVPSVATNHVFADSMTMLRRNLVRAKRYPGMTFGLIIMPVILMLMFNYIFGGALKTATGSSHYIDYLTPGMMLMIPAYMVVGVAVSVATDMTKGIVNRFRTMHIAPSAMLTGQVIGTWIVGVLGVTLMTVVAVACGFRSHDAGVGKWLLAAAIVATLIYVLSWLGVAFGLVAKTPESASNLPMPIVMLPFLGSGFVPTSTMPTGVKQFAEYQPFSPIAETVRGLLMGTPIGHNGVWAVGWILVIGLVGYFWSTTLFRRKTI